MKKISTPSTFFYKRIFPVLWFGFIALFLGIGSWAAITSGRLAEAAPGLVVPVGMAVLGVFLFRKLLFDLMDEVYDAGDALVVRNAGREERISLSNIKNVNFQAFVNPPRITLSLRIPSNFGAEVSFIPKARFGEVFYGKNPLVQDLVNRVDAARK